MAVVVRPEETQLRLGYPGGRRVTVAAPGVPSLASDPWPTTMRPVAVRISARGGASRAACSRRRRRDLRAWPSASPRPSRGACPACTPYCPLS